MRLVLAIVFSFPLSGDTPRESRHRIDSKGLESAGPEGALFVPFFQGTKPSRSAPAPRRNAETLNLQCFHGVCPHGASYPRHVLFPRQQQSALHIRLAESADCYPWLHSNIMDWLYHLRLGLVFAGADFAFSSHSFPLAFSLSESESKSISPRTFIASREPESIALER